MSDTTPGNVETGLRKHLRVITNVTGETPNTCPWRAFYDPLVAEVIALRWAMDPPNLDAVLEPDPPGILVEALKVFSLAVNATLAEDRKIQKARDDAKRAADSRRNR